MLSNEIYQLGIHTTGTIRENRKGLSAAIKSRKLKVHVVLAYQKDNRIMVLQWRDTLFPCGQKYNVDSEEMQLIINKFTIYLEWPLLFHSTLRKWMPLIWQTNTMEAMPFYENRLNVGERYSFGYWKMVL